MRDDTRGASLVEYILLVGVVALAAIAAFRYFSGSVRTAVEREAYQVRTLEGSEPGSSTGTQSPPSSQPGAALAANGSAESPQAVNGVESLRSSLPPSATPSDQGAGAGNGESVARSGKSISKAQAALQADKFIAGVQKVMCPRDSAFLQTLKARGVTITAYERIYFEDPYFDGTKWTTKVFPAGGSTSGTAISIVIGSPEATAATIYHEGVHTGQPATMDWRDMEYDAYTKSEEWAIARGLPPHDPSFRTRDASGRETVNTAAIKASVDRDYPGITANPSQSGRAPDQIVGRAANGNTILKKSDGTTYERKPKRGDSFSAVDQKADPVGGIPIDMNKLQCP